MDSKEGKDGKEGKEGKEERETVRVGPLRRYQDLLIYQQAYRLALEVSRLTKSFPRQEQYELGKQLRASSRSVAANIVEGWAKRNSPAEFRRHLIIAKGECVETEFWLELSGDEGLATSDRSGRLRSDYGRLAMMIHNLWKEWRKF